MSAARRVDLDLVLGPWLEETATPRRVEYLGEVLERTSGMRQRPAWSFPGRWLPAGWTVEPFARSRVAWLLLLLTALVVALVVAALAAGYFARPVPTLLGRPGLIALDSGHHIAVMNPDGTGLRLLASGSEVDTSPVWSPDGNLIAFWRAAGIGHWTIMVVDTSGGVRGSVAVQARTPLPYPEGDPRWSMLPYALGAPSFLTWSPDSSRLAFSQEVDGVSGIWVVGADGRDLTRLGNPDLPAADPYWSPDGTRIAFHGGRTGSNDGDGNGLYVMRADGTGARRVSRVAAAGEAFSDPQWQPGGELIAFIASPAGVMHIVVVGSDGTGERDISDPAPGEGINDWIPRWSPDGTRIAFLRNSNACGAGQIVVTDPQGHGAAVWPCDRDLSLGGPLWSPDGHAVSALKYDTITGATSGLVTFDLIGGAPPVILPAPANLGGSSWQWLRPEG